MENKIYFKAREWQAIPHDNNINSRTFMTGTDGKLTEVYMLGDWNWNWSEITSVPLQLEKKTEYTFTFWLNGGENDRNDEICQFVILHTDDPAETVSRDREMVYKLNRNYIRPVKRHNGWELYEIPFTASDREYTRLKFIAMRAPMAVMTAGDVNSYAQLADTPDEFEEVRPQRHNIVFSDGFPTDKWYSTKNLRSRPDVDNFHTDGNNQSSNHTFKGGNGLNTLLRTISQKLEDIDLEDIEADVIDSLTNMLSVAAGLAPFA